ncbi:MerR family transcriptional regulator [bacterium]|nr:MerR family transcriptional regulator [bacterium]
MWTIGKLAKKASVTPRTIRYYEELALIQPKLRGDNRFRYYDESHFLRLNTIKLLQSLGYGLKDISAALAPFVDSDGRCSPTGQEMSQKISLSLLNVRNDLLSKKTEIDTALKGIDEMSPQLKVCLGCTDSQTLSECIGCTKGPEAVIQMARELTSAQTNTH